MAIMKVGAAGIETISGAMKKPKKIDGHNHGNYLVATHRKAASENPNCQRVYSFDADRYKRSTPLSPTELWLRQRFTAVRAAVQTRSEDLTKYNADLAAFQAQRDKSNGKKTMKAWYWAQEAETYDTNHPRP